MSQSGWSDIHLKDADFEVIKKFAKENDLKLGAAVRKAFKDAYGLKFQDR